MMQAYDQIRKIENRADAGEHDQLERRGWTKLKTRRKASAENENLWLWTGDAIGKAYAARLVLFKAYTNQMMRRKPRNSFANGALGCGRSWANRRVPRTLGARRPNC